jgi:hypothetical protein
VEKRLFLDRIALYPSHIAKGHTEFAVPMESHLTDSATPFRDEASVTAGNTAETLTLPPKEATATV